MNIIVSVLIKFRTCLIQAFLYAKYDKTESKSESIRRTQKITLNKPPRLIVMLMIKIKIVISRTIILSESNSNNNDNEMVV